MSFFCFNWGYFTLFEAFWNGRTPGKRVARIRVIQRSGRAIGLFESMARNLVRYIDMHQFPLVYAVGVIAMFATRQHQRLGDLAAGTLVVRDREQERRRCGAIRGRGPSRRRVFARRHSSSGAAHGLIRCRLTGIAKLSSTDLEVLEGFFARQTRYDPADTRYALAERIAAAIQAKSGLERPAGASVETFLEATARQLRDLARMQ